MSHNLFVSMMMVPESKPFLHQSGEQVQFLFVATESMTIAITIAVL
jgi:hypothetical protein